MSTYRLLTHDPDGGCKGCPFRSDDWNSDDVCAADPDRRDVHEDDPTAPAWCPLRSGAVLVTRPT